MTVRELTAALSGLPGDLVVVRAGPVFLLPVSSVAARDLAAVPADGARGPRYRGAEPWDAPAGPPFVVLS